MHQIFGHWKYIFKNLWFVLPFAVMPAIFLALSVNYQAIVNFSRAFFGGKELTYFSVFYAWSLIRFDSLLGALYSVCALFCAVVFLSALYSFAEKHMRIGKRTLSGVFSQFRNQMLTVAAIIILYLCLYELWALVLSAMLYTVSALGARGITYFLFFFIVILFFAALLFLATVFYLWLPCMQITGMHAYNAFLYSYRLMGGVRGRLMLSLLTSLVPAFLVYWGCSFLPTPASVAIVFVVGIFLILSFTVRMEIYYFELDKIDREDLIRSYREL